MSQPSSSPESQALSRQLFEVLESYQADLRQLLHSELCQSLGSALLLARARANNPPADTAAAFRELGLLIAQTVENALAVGRRLYPIAPEPGGLMEGLAEMARRSPASCNFVCEEPFLIDDSTRALAIYRLAEAAISLVIRTLGTAPLTLTLARTEQYGTLELAFSEPLPAACLNDPALASLAIVAGASPIFESGKSSLNWRIMALD